MAMNCNVTNDKVSGNMVIQEEVLAGLLATFVLRAGANDAISPALPGGVKVLSAESYGTSAWSLTGRINAVKPDGSSARYFIKVRSIGIY
jgi:protein-ribulosamine 3-kinase